MAQRKPSERRMFKEHEQDLNLTPMMNLIAILIPTMLVSVAFVTLSAIEVTLPSMVAETSEDPESLSLTVTITDRGFIIATAGAVLDAEPASMQGVGSRTIPIVQRKVSCQRYVGTWPPPRQKNASINNRCGKASAERLFWVYDLDALHERLVGIKTAFGQERKLVIAAEPDIEYEALIDVMDASRSYMGPSGLLQPLFDQVLLSPRLTTPG